MSVVRYAVFYSPHQATTLSHLADTWLGYSAWKFARVDQAGFAGLSAGALDRATANPRKYGFHATLKAPFRLKAGETESALLDAVEAQAALLSPVEIPKMDIRWLGPHLALVHKVDSPPLRALAANVVEAFESFRAQLTDDEMERRLRVPLTNRQRELLAQWGYPYVMDEFRFHMTLAGPIVEDQRDSVERAARAHFQPVSEHSLKIDRLAVFKQPGADQPFYVLESFEIGAPGRSRSRLPRTFSAIDA